METTLIGFDNLKAKLIELSSEFDENTTHDEIRQFIIAEMNHLTAKRRVYSEDFDFVVMQGVRTCVYSIPLFSYFTRSKREEKFSVDVTFAGNTTITQIEYKG